MRFEKQSDNFTVRDTVLNPKTLARVRNHPIVRANHLNTFPLSYQVLESCVILRNVFQFMSPEEIENNPILFLKM